ncbi:hypothetical protein Prum_092690 [Phytohabitans rumicis]|uniref:Uncharacterized protein n=3 Tax=Phytohabitans rumicis TaxID=1076125 RepID=A0A6V8LNG8_9ACTN|nr:hypothetical protein Prum_092690 [Phytohabitans rumicis]
MRNLTDELYAAVDSPPPSGIDVDRLITVEQRRTRRLRWAGGGAALSAAVAVAFLVSPTAARVDKTDAGPATGELAPVAADCPRVSGGDRERHGLPQYTRDPRLTESCADATARLTAVLRPAFSKIVPGMTAQGFVLNDYNAQYESVTRVTTTAGAGKVKVMLRTTQTQPMPTAEECKDGCSHEARPDGTVIEVFDGTREQIAHRVDVYLPDHTVISVHASLLAEGADRHLPLSIAETKALALTPASPSSRKSDGIARRRLEQCTLLRPPAVFVYCGEGCAVIVAAASTQVSA